MFTNAQEQQFFLSHIQKTDYILEYGSGQSTIEIAKLAKFILSIEHDKIWYDKLLNIIPHNCRLLLNRPDSDDYQEGKSDGTYEQFKNYTQAPIQYGPYDIIFIDGRARVECAKTCRKMCHDKTLIFIHDFDRSEYQEIKNILQFKEQVHTMAKFTI